MGSGNFGRVMVLGSRGMVGSACIRELEKHSSVSEIIPVWRDQVDLTNQAATFRYIASERPDWIIMAAAKVGGIYANSAFPKDFIYENLAIELNVIEGAHRAGIEKLIFLGSSCIYPKYAKQPIFEDSLLTGYLESTNEPYAIAKIAGIKLCESYNRQLGTDFRCLMPTNLYGPGDNYHPQLSHVIPGLMRRLHESKLNSEKCVKVWGSGKALREFLFVRDLADAIIFVMGLEKEVFSSVSPDTCSHINVGSGQDHTIADLADILRRVTGYEGELQFDMSKPDGTPQKLLDVTKMLTLGWSAKMPLESGLIETYKEFRLQYDKC